MLPSGASVLAGSLSNHAIVENLRVDVGLGGLTRSRSVRVLQAYMSP